MGVKHPPEISVALLALNKSFKKSSNNLYPILS
jgi:hypothetical protein